MRTYLTFKNSNEEELRPEFHNQDTRFPLSFAEYFIKKYTKLSDNILDPFAGFGTTLIAAERLNRVGYGVELDLTRYNYIKSKIGTKSVIAQGSAMDLLHFGFPKMDFSITSPPYMHKNERLNPLMDYKTASNYDQFLWELKIIYSKVKEIMKPAAYILIEASNLIINDEISLLAWDICRSISEVLVFKKEIIICWEGENKGKGIYGYGYDHSYCLLFQNLMN